MTKKNVCILISFVLLAAMLSLGVAADLASVLSLDPVIFDDGVAYAHAVEHYAYAAIEWDYADDLYVHAHIENGRDTPVVDQAGDDGRNRSSISAEVMASQLPNIDRYPVTKAYADAYCGAIELAIDVYLS